MKKLVLITLLVGSLFPKIFAQKADSYGLEELPWTHSGTVFTWNNYNSGDTIFLNFTYPYLDKQYNYVLMEEYEVKYYLGSSGSMGSLTEGLKLFFNAFLYPDEVKWGYDTNGNVHLVWSYNDLWGFGNPQFYIDVMLSPDGVIWVNQSGVDNYASSAIFKLENHIFCNPQFIELQGNISNFGTYIIRPYIMPDVTAPHFLDGPFEVSVNCDSISIGKSVYENRGLQNAGIIFKKNNQTLLNHQKVNYQPSSGCFSWGTSGTFSNHLTTGNVITYMYAIDSSQWQADTFRFGSFNFRFFDDFQILQNDTALSIGSNITLKASTNKSAGIILSEVVLSRTGIGSTVNYPNYISPTGNNFIEITNISKRKINIGGYQLKIAKLNQNPILYQFPLNTFLDSGSVAVVHIGTGTDSPQNLYFNTQTPSNQFSINDKLAIVLETNDNFLLDCFYTSPSYENFPFHNIGWYNIWPLNNVLNLTNLETNGRSGFKRNPANLNIPRWYLSGSLDSTLTLGSLNQGFTTRHTESVTWQPGNLIGWEYPITNFQNATNVTCTLTCENPFLHPGCFTDNVTLSVFTSTSKPDFNEIQFFPNPVKDKMYFNSISNSEVMIYDVLGNLVLHSNIQNNELNVSKLPAGIYISKILLNEQIRTFRFIKL